MKTRVWYVQEVVPQLMRKAEQKSPVPIDWDEEELKALDEMDMAKSLHIERMRDEQEDVRDALHPQRSVRRKYQDLAGATLDDDLPYDPWG
jgi:hypothetical protein